MRRLALSALCFCAVGCASAQDKLPFSVQEIAEFDEPWAMAFMPGGRLLVTEKAGRLLIVTPDGREKTPVSGLPEVDHGGQGGLGDVALHPDFASNRIIYLSYAEAGDGGTRGAAVIRARLDSAGDGGSLSDVSVIWRQLPKVTGRGHYGHRLLLHGGYLWISSGERQKFDPAQDMQGNLGKVLRLNEDGSVPDDNPFAERGGVSAQIWSLGHRNPLGLAVDLQGRLWDVEMGPAGGDELNLVVGGDNYGYPIVSNGDHYDGRDIPDHPTRPEFAAPKVWWTPVISPGGMIIYKGSEFSEWRGNALIAGLSSRALVRVDIDGDSAREVERYDMGKRIRAVVEATDGAIWLLEDERGGRLLRLMPNRAPAAPRLL